MTADEQASLNAGKYAIFRNFVNRRGCRGTQQKLNSAPPLIGWMTQQVRQNDSICQQKRRVEFIRPIWLVSGLEVFVQVGLYGFQQDIVQFQVPGENVPGFLITLSSRNIGHDAACLFDQETACGRVPG